MASRGLPTRAAEGLGPRLTPLDDSRFSSRFAPGSWQKTDVVNQKQNQANEIKKQVHGPQSRAKWLAKRLRCLTLLLLLLLLLLRTQYTTDAKSA